MKRITVAGLTASGKTTFANRLSEILNIPVYHLDKIFWTEKKGISQENFISQQENILKNDSWIIDVHFWRSKSFDLRLEKSDTIIFFDFPKIILYWRLLKRAYGHYGKNRPDMPENFIQLFPWHSLKYIWETPTKEALFKVLNYSSFKNVVVFKRPKNVQDYLNNHLSDHFRKGEIS